MNQNTLVAIQMGKISEGAQRDDTTENDKWETVASDIYEFLTFLNDCDNDIRPDVDLMNVFFRVKIDDYIIEC